MKILIATGIYPPDIGGPATYTAAMAEALQKKGHEVTVVTYGEKSRSGEEGVDRFGDAVVWKRWSVSRGGGPVIRYLRYAWRAFCLARRADLVYAQGAVSEGLPATIGARLAGRPVVMRVPGDYAWEMAMQRGETKLLDDFLKQRHGGLIGFYDWMERWTSRQARCVIVPSKYLKSVVERWGVMSEKIFVIQNAVEAFWPVIERRHARKGLGVGDEDVILFSVVRAVPWKGVAELIEWWKELPSSHVLVVAGDGPELEKWKQLAVTNGVADRIKFLGQTDRMTTAWWYAAADAFVLHSGYEGWPFVVAEAASIGLPCLISDQGGNPETKNLYGDLVTVLPYQNKAAWVDALRVISHRADSKVVSPARSWSFDDMVAATDRALTERPVRIAMISYEKDFFDPQSNASKRLVSLAQGVEIVPIIISGKKFFSSIRAGVRARPTVVTAQDPFAAGVIGYLISRWTNAPLEIQEHGDFFSGAWKKEKWTNRIWFWVGRFILRHAERVRAVSERVKEHLIAIGVEEKKIEVIPVAQIIVGADRVRPSDSHGEGASIAPLRIIAPCRFVPQKGLDVLIEAVALLKKNGRSFHLSIVGRGPLEGELREQINRAGLSAEITIEPWKKSDALWQDAHLFVMSSRYEGWGRTIVEAMAAGVPIVTTEVGCVGSFFRPNVDGLAVPINNAQALAQAIEKQMTDTVARERMRQSALQRVATFPSQDELHERQRAGWRGMIGQVCETRPRFDLWVGAFLVFAVVSRAASVILFHNSLLNREWGFFHLVESWFQGYGYSYAHQLGCASAYRSPAYLFFLTALYSVFSPNNTWAQAIVQNLFVVGVLWLVYAVGKKLVGKRAALVGAFLMAAYPYAFYHYTQYYHTFLSSFFLLLMVWFLLRLQETKRIRFAVASGLSIACLAYVQGTILPATPLIALWLFVTWWGNWKRALTVIAIMAACAIGLIAPWTYRNWTVFHQFVPLTTDLGLGMFKANNENIFALTERGYPQEVVDVETVSSTNPGYVQERMEPEALRDLTAAGVLQPSKFWTQWHPKDPSVGVTTCATIGPMDEATYNQYWTGLATAWIKTHPSEFVRLELLKIKTFWQPSLFPSKKYGAPWPFSGWKEVFARWAVTIMAAIVIFGGWIGLLLVLRNTKSAKIRNAWLPLIIVTVYTLLHSVFAGYTKYRIPLDNLMAIYAGWTIVALWDRFKKLF